MGTKYLLQTLVYESGAEFYTFILDFAQSAFSLFSLDGDIKLLTADIKYEN